MSREYEDAFNAEDAPLPVADEAGMPAADPVVAAEPMPEPILESAPVDAPPTADDIQREKSWEGRLALREAELKRREEALMAQSAPAPAAEDPAPEPEAEAPSEEDASIAEMAAEFPALHALVMKTVASEVGKAMEKLARIDALDETVTSLIRELGDERTRSHREAIFDAFPDADKIAASPEFIAFCQSQSNPDECRRIVESGTTREVIGLLKAFQTTLQAPAAPDTSLAADAAEGVRGSAPLAIAQQKAANPLDEYAAAWNNA